MNLKHRLSAALVAGSTLGLGVVVAEGTLSAVRQPPARASLTYTLTQGPMP